VVIAVSLVPADALSGFTERLSMIWNGLGDYERTSASLRLVYPYVTLIDTWLNWPLFGVGISGKEVVADQTRLVLDRPIEAIGNNAMGELGTYLGIIGSFLFLFLMSRHLRHTGVRRLGLMLLLVVFFSQLMGGLESIRYWGYVGLFWGALTVSDSGLDAAANADDANPAQSVAAGERGNNGFEGDPMGTPVNGGLYR